VPTIKRLAEFERIAGIKDSSGDLTFMMRMMSAVKPIRPDFFFLTAGTHSGANVGHRVDGGTKRRQRHRPELTGKCTI